MDVFRSPGGCEEDHYTMPLAVPDDTSGLRAIDAYSFTVDEELRSRADTRISNQCSGILGSCQSRPRDHCKALNEANPRMSQDEQELEAFREYQRDAYQAVSVFSTSWPQTHKHVRDDIRSDHSSSQGRPSISLLLC